MKRKFRTYAIFQFLSIITLTSVIGVLLALAYENANETSKIDDKFWSNAMKRTLRFDNDAPFGIFASIFTYSTLVIWMLTWIVGLQVLKFEERNLYDSLFLLFFFVPLLSNVLAMFAQMSLKTNDYTSYRIDKKEIKKATEDILEKEKQKKNAKK